MEVLQILPDDKKAIASETNVHKYYTKLVYERFTSPTGQRRVNDWTINIEVNPIDNDGNFSNETYTTLVRLTADKLLEYGLDVDTGLFRHADFTTKDCPKLFTNPNEVWKTYMDENGRTMGIVMKKMVLPLLIILNIFFACCSCTNTDLQKKINQLEYELEKSVTKHDEINAEKIELDETYNELYEKLSVAEAMENAIHGRYEICVYNIRDNTFDFSIDIDPYDCYNIITIVGYDFEDPIVKGDVKVLDHRENNGAVIKVKIVGNLFNFRISRLGWDTVKLDYYEKKVICQYDKLTNTDILFSSILSEGVAGEAISWEDKNGSKHIYYLSDAGFDSGFKYPGGIVIFNK